MIEQLKTQVVNCTKINQDNKQVNELLTAELERYKNQKRVLKEQQNDDKAVIEKSDAIVVHDSEETLLLAEESRSKMIEKQNDPKMAEKKVITKPIDYAVLNQLSKDFETHFVPQTELSAEQVFWSRYSVQPEEPSLSASTTIVEVPKELPKVSLRNTLFSQESALTFAELFEINDLRAQAQAKDTVILKLREKLYSLTGDVNERKVKRELEEIETLNIELDHKVTKLVAENEHLKQTYKKLYDSIKSSRVPSKEQCDDLINKVNLKSAEVSDLNASLQEKVLVITALKETLSKLKGKAVVTEAVSLHPLDPELLKIDVTPLAPKLRKNRTAHTDYIRHTQAEAATLREIVESERLINPLNTSLDYASSGYDSKNKDKQIRLTKHIPKSGKTTVPSTLSTNVVSNTPVLSSTGVTLLSSASGSQSSNNTKNDRIWRTPRKAKTKLEDHLRPVRPSLNKKSDVDTKATSYVTNSMIATTTIVPPREPIPIASNTDKPVITLVYSRKSKAVKKVPVSNSTINKSLVANKMEPNNSWGSSSSNVPSSLIKCRLSKLFYGIWTPAAQSI
nr:integrase, catalytic region, zinc finger, CCHC-type, peptidase aspartic, catalytic [Tanacetum cinerariifolium]